MLDIAKVKTAIGMPSPTEGNLSTHVTMVVERYQELARQKGVTLSYRSDAGDIETTFIADYIEKMVGNLLSNAIKFAPEGGTVDTTLHREGESLLLTVSDNGPGIAASDLPHIFEPFYRATDAASGGSGVGLALVKQIVDAIGGRVTVDSREGHGTTFRVDIPCSSVGQPRKAEPAQPLPAEQPGRDGEAKKSALPRQQQSILIVEDNADVAALMGRLLGHRYQLHYAVNGDVGIAKARKLMPDIIVTDLMMPGTDGLELCRTIRGDDSTSHIPIIVVTAKATENDRIKGRQAGADEYLYKPFNAEELNLCIDNLLAARERLRQHFGQTTAAYLPAGDGSMGAQPYTFTHPSSDFIRRVRDTVIQLMPQRQADVEHVASVLCISPFQLRSKLTAITGQTPIKYILAIRLEEARRLLTEQRERTVADISETCGFYDKSHFTRSFRDAFGVTPGNYVKSLDEAAEHTDIQS